MYLNSLKIGDIECKLPIIQGGMGVGVSLSNLAASVSLNGGIGVISAAQIGFKEDDFETNPVEANIRALKKHIKIAKEKALNKLIGVNIMCASENYSTYVKTAIDAGADLIISGAGIPSELPKIAKGTKAKLIPIISSFKGCRVILKLWDRKAQTAPDGIIIEGPKAGGHLGFHADELDTFDFDSNIKDILEEIKPYEKKYNKSIPLIIAGGVFDGKDIKHYLSLGASGVQMATRFVATEECDADIKFKETYVNAKKEDVCIVKSPVGMPGRAIKNKFVEKTGLGNLPVKKCYNCLTPCNPAVTPYCITEALINAARGDIDNGLVFCGSNVDKITEISTVEKIMKELEEDLS